MSETSQKPVTIYLTRHSKTTSNAMQLMQGWSDFPLTREGRDIVRQFGAGLKGIRFTAAYCGNLTRHYNTARIALDTSGNEDVEIGIDPDLREDNFGSFEGRSIPDTLQAIADRLGFASFAEALESKGERLNIDLQDVLHDLDQENVLHTDLDDEDRAESAEQVQQRMHDAIVRIARNVSEQGGGNVLVISSGTSIRQFFASIDPSISLADMGNTAVTTIIYKDGTFRVDGPVASMEYYERGALA